MPDDTAPILVTSDLSDRSDRAIERAFKLAKKLQRTLILFSALDDAMPEDIAVELEAKARKVLTRLADSLSDGVEYVLHIDIGDPTTAILEEIAGTNPFLLVMGMHRIRGLFDGLRETTMQRIVRYTDCPVLLVRDRADHDYEKVLAACDFSPASTAAITMADALTGAATITPIHAVHVPFGGLAAQTPGAMTELEASFRREAETMDEAWRDRNRLPDSLSETNIVVGSPYMKIHEEIERSDVDLLAVGAHGRVGAARALLGSLANDLMREPLCDLLITRPAHTKRTADQ